MFTINESNNSITMTRGDTAVIGLDLKNYKEQDGDEIVITIKKKITDTEAVICKYAEDGVIVLMPSETIGLLGRHVYDIQITTAAGAVYTPILSTITFERGVTEGNEPEK